MKLLPDPKDYPANRLFCLDMLRGLDMFYLAALSGILVALLKACGCPEAAKFCGYHPWYGFTLYDIIMPLFIFMSGAAVPLALSRRLDGNGRMTAAFHRHVWSRFALLWILGMLAQGSLQTLDPKQISPYCNTLQTIAVGYVATAYVLTIRSWIVKIAIPVALAAAYGLVVHFCGDYTGPGNATMPVEKWVLSFLVPADSTRIRYLLENECYTWWLPSLMFPVIALCGAFSTILLSKKDLSEWKRAACTFAFGAASLALGLVLEAMGVKCVKHIFTVSFTFQAIGYSILALAALYVVCDIWKIRRGTGIILLYGQFALAAYLGEAVFRKACEAANDRLFVGFQQFVDKPFAPVVAKIGFLVVVTALLVIWRGYKLSRKAGFAPGLRPCLVFFFAFGLSLTGRADRFEIWQDHADALYRAGEEAQIRVTVLKDDGTIRREGKVQWTLDNFGSLKVGAGEQDLAAENPFFVRGTLAHPDFLRLSVTSGKAKRVWSVGYNVGEIRQAKARPDDFDAYWAGEKARLAKIPLDPKCEKLDWLCREKWDTYRISFATLNDRRLYGFMTVPKDASLKPMRCRVRICDAGGGAVGPWEANAGEVTVTMNVHYFEPPRDAKAMRAKIDETSAAWARRYGMPTNTYYAKSGIGVSREDYYFHDAMLGLARAFDWLAERPFVDPDRLVYYGSSQGGGFGLATTYLNPRFSRAVYCVPAITGHYGTPTGSAVGWPTLIGSQNPDQRVHAEKFAAYFDGVNFAAGIRIPCRFIVGFSDTCCPPPDVYSAYNLCPAKDKAILNAIGGTHCREYGALGWINERKRLNPLFDIDGWLRAPDPKRTHVQLWFDTEDYTNPSAWDNIREIAKIMTAEGVKGNFNVAPYLAKVLVDKRRFDVIDAMKKHVIGTQTLYHSWHPNVTEIGDGEDYAAAYDRTLRDEAEGWGMLRAAFGLDRLILSCYPGCGSSYVAMDVHSDLGATFQGGLGAFGGQLKSGDRIWYQNMRQIDYNGWSLQNLGLSADHSEAQIAAMLDTMSKKDAVVFYMHPCIASCVQFWDGQNMRKGNWAEFGHWIPADRRPQEATDRFYKRFAAFIRQVKADPRFEITDCEKLAADCKPRRPITLAEIPAIRASLLKRFGHIDDPASWSVADAFQAAVRLLRGEKAYVPGKVYGFLAAPVGVKAPVVVRASDLRAAAAKISLKRHLATSYDVGGVTIGPADFLFAALEVLATGADEVKVEPRDQLGDIAAECAPLATFTHRGKWIFPDTMKDEYLSDRLRWQFWTLRYE